METLTTILTGISDVVALIGGAIILGGVVSAIYRLGRVEFAMLRKVDLDHDRRTLRQHFGYYILLGLEFLIAADILRTLIHPGTEELITLGVVVLIRTVISVTLHWELSRPEHAKEDHP
jgi:uncharacterized membrane protein